MATTFNIYTYADITTSVVQDVFRTMLYSDVHEASSEAYDSRSSIVTAAIFFNGDWKGGAFVECTPEQAKRFTEQLMNIPRPETIDDDTRDAMGELANMIGGNLKSALPKGVSLSLPCVFYGADNTFKIYGANEQFRIAFRGEDGPFWVTLFTQFERIRASQSSIQ